MRDNSVCHVFVYLALTRVHACRSTGGSNSNVTSCARCLGPCATAAGPSACLPACLPGLPACLPCFACASLCTSELHDDSGRARTEVGCARSAEVSGGDLLLGPDWGPARRGAVRCGTANHHEHRSQWRRWCCGRSSVQGGSESLYVCMCVCVLFMYGVYICALVNVQMTRVGGHGCIWREKVPRASKRTRVPPSRVPRAQDRGSARALAACIFFAVVAIVAKVPRGGTKNGCEFCEEERKKKKDAEAYLKRSRRCLGRRILRISFKWNVGKRGTRKTMTDEKWSDYPFYMHVKHARF